MTPGRKTIIIKKPALAKKATAPISVFVEQARGNTPPTSMLSGPEKKPAAPPPPPPPPAGAGGVKTFKFYCIRCGQKLAAQSSWVGREVNCNTCGRAITIPSAEDE